ncbi:hypothetical protein Q5P01_014385 [Channa striata]|uniref:F-box domain-containing protein n=1 Tax=Channa striata TaxID=64152 RepID=A0AA88SKX4_CHASR|nr:hypothetical protein Q5P01_014385 [Channa striata]
MVQYFRRSLSTGSVSAGKQQAKNRSNTSTTTMETHHSTAVGHVLSELLEDPGNCRPSVHQALDHHCLSDSVFSERQKLRVVLDWAHSFLGSGSEVRHELCTANNLKLADKKQKETAKTSCKHSFSAKLSHPDSCTAGYNEERVTAVKVWHLDPSKTFPTNNGSTDMTYGSAQPDGKQKENAKHVGNSGTTCKESSSDFVMYSDDNLSHSRPQKTMAETVGAACQFKVPSGLSVYEQYQLCVDQVHNLRLRQSRHTEPGCTTDSPEEGRKTCEEPAAPDEEPDQPPSSFKLNSSSKTPEHKKSQNKVQIKTWTCAEISEERSGNRDGAASKTNGPSIGEREERKHCDSFSAKENAATNTGHLSLCSNKHKGFMKRTEAVTANDNVINTHLEHLGAAPADVEERSVLTAEPGPTVNADANIADCESSPTGVALCDWPCLPDEVWLSVLSLLSHRDLCTVGQVCSRLRTLAADYTLWKCLRIENATLTERWLLSVGKRRPRSLSLYSCSGLPITSRGLEMFFTLCRDTLEEISVTSCTGLGLHGDQILPLVGQLCDYVTSVDVSWSGTTDKGVKALSYTCSGLKLRSVALNGCHITDEPLKDLVMKHRRSLCRLEVFGCQFLTSSCLQTVYETCPGLQHLNIGQVPKVNAHSLRAMSSHLKCLISLNLTGLQAVTDATLENLLQNCVELQILTLSSCPGVTDLTLHNISKCTPCIRSLNVSGCGTITDLGVQSLTLGCRRLQQLDLSSTRTGNRGVALLANYCSVHLHTVKLSFCHISLENILKLCRNCKRLNVLHLYGCPPSLWLSPTRGTSEK